MATEIPFFGTQPGQSSRFDQQFSYDQLNRIKSSKQVSGVGYETSYLYDPNGNIEKLTRNDAQGNPLDGLHYNYENKSNPIKDQQYKYNTNKLRYVGAAEDASIHVQGGKGWYGDNAGLDTDDNGIVTKGEAAAVANGWYVK